jgi:hypothetical protein
MRSQRGQATIDYVALIAVLTLVLAAAAAVASGGAPGIANAVIGQVRHALCVVTGGACSAAPGQPCVVASERDARHVGASVLFIRLDGDRWLLRERMSDGTVRLTLGHRGGAGVELGIGARAKLKIKGRTIGVDDEARLAAQGVLGYAEVYVARDDREADEILHAIRHRIPLIGGDGPDPSERFVEGGRRGLGRLGLGGLIAGVSLEGNAETILAAHRVERTGNVTITLSAGRAGWALLSAVMAGPSGSSDAQVTLGLTLDRDHRPIGLSLSATGTLAAGASLPTGMARALGVRDDGDAQLRLTGRRWELGARLDLHDPVVAAAWSAFRDNPADLGAIRALGTALRTRAWLDSRIYRVSSESDGGAAGLGLGLRVGGELDHTVDRARLLAASTRPAGGVWEQRRDCVPA